MGSQNVAGMPASGMASATGMPSAGMPSAAGVPGMPSETAMPSGMPSDAMPSHGERDGERADHYYSHHSSMTRDNLNEIVSGIGAGSEQVG
jgi:hypothetical protein